MNKISATSLELLKLGICEFIVDFAEKNKNKYSATSIEAILDATKALLPVELALTSK